MRTLNAPVFVTRSLCYGFLGIALCTSSDVFANNGVMLPAYGSKAWGMGGASIAYPQDSIASANNPAGIALVGDRIDADLSVINAPLKAESGSNTYRDTARVPIPGAGISKTLNSDVAVGISLFSQGLDLNYEKPILGAKNTRNKLTQMVLAPTATWQFKPGQYLGFSPRIAYQHLDLAGVDGLGASYNGGDSAYGFGVSIGYLGQITERLKVGATYASPIWFQKLRRYENLLPDALNLPQQAGVGISYQLNNSFTLAVDALWIDWSAEKSYGNSMTEGGALGQGNGPGFGWKDQYIYRAGGDYRIDDHWSVRAGISLASKLIGNDQVLLGILAPLNQYDHYSMGATYALSKTWEMTGSYMHALHNTTTGSGASAGAKISGEIDYFNIGLAYKY
ncbi:OmpP1/FadL family transporter [Pseudomonas yamanorum]|uniref:OmpP1/FadL family transporter n=1 Tax=Pseudomonas yamanorum TaxID=515393 RepID=UPI003F752AF6